MKMKYLAGGESWSYLIMPKCGNTAIREAIGRQLGRRESLQVWLPEYLIDGPRGFSFTLVRDPVERLLSLWWDKTQVAGRDVWRINRQLSEIWGQYGKLFWIGMSFEEFIDVVESIGFPGGEDHFRPMAHIIEREGAPQFVGLLGNANHWDLIRSETCLPELKPVRVAVNRPTRLELSAKMTERIRQLYAADVELYERVRNN